MCLDISKSNIGIIIKNIYSDIDTLPITMKCIAPNHIHKLKNIIKIHQPTICIIGLSTNKYNILTENGRFTKNFIHKHRFVLPKFMYYNEYLSTKIGIVQYPDYNPNIAAALVIFHNWQQNIYQEYLGCLFLVMILNI